MKDFMGMMKQAQQLQAKMAEMQQQLAETEIEGSAGGGLVSVTLDGKGSLKHVNIDESLLKPEEREIVEDLVVTAHAAARSRLEEVMQERMQEVTGGLPLPPGMKLF
ncbi:MAG: YbaB/EbfC family nucleoid-associated protein [Rhodobiaceae bacterium]|nr:YbaB/EbfC family nucleoid-associated protein [Rhodobiaceae bacterium]MCC0017916.1 YbaB/EbfC family nucleoid-associated protein [Rhodobiaceae bacterium]MCC0051565.1 YbaB/EbfC family nucleoid-associated protein [Rhodobiaceae bacterium]MCC0062132.1 YbaB/EbfC family nucleoid-associated protein [Rhodobiaceae bacterium]